MVSMRKEILNWRKQAERDFLSAKNAFQAEDYYAATFWCHQAIEKALKALIMEKQRKKEISSHSLIFLAKEAKVPEKFYDFLRELTPQYIITRHPSASEEAPFELFSQTQAKEFIEKSKEVISWIKKQIR